MRGTYNCTYYGQLAPKKGGTKRKKRVFQPKKKKGQPIPTWVGRVSLMETKGKGGFEMGKQGEGDYKKEEKEGP